jgi:hypothetical protein
MAFNDLPPGKLQDITFYFPAIGSKGALLSVIWTPRAIKSLSHSPMQNLCHGADRKNPLISVGLANNAERDDSGAAKDCQ